MKSIHESIAKVRNAVRYVRASPARFEKFQECVENEKIKPNVCCPLMCQQSHVRLCFKICESIFDRLEKEDGHNKLYFCEADGNRKKPIGPPNYLD